MARILKNFAVGNRDEMDGWLRDLSESFPYMDCDIALMPDAHLGKSCAVGTVIRYRGAVVPNTVGVDISCSVSAYDIGKTVDELDMEEVDRAIHAAVPCGFSLRDEEAEESKSFDYMALRCWDSIKDKEERFRHSMGTMGGGKSDCLRAA